MIQRTKIDVAETREYEFKLYVKKDKEELIQIITNDVEKYFNSFLV